MILEKTHNFGHPLKIIHAKVIRVFAVALIAAVIVIMMGNGTAAAQTIFIDPPEKFPQPSAGLDVGMIYHRLINVTPNFETWSQDGAVKGAKPSEDKARIGAANMQNTYENISLRTPIIVRQQLQLASYSGVLRGYGIQNLNAATYFPFEFADEKYALVPVNIADYLFAPVEDEAEKNQINAVLSSSKPAIWAAIYIMPLSATADAPADLDGVSRNLVAGKIVKVALYGSRQKSLLADFTAQEAVRP